MNKISKEKFTELLSISGLPLENPEILQNNDIEMIDYGEDIDNIPNDINTSCTLKNSDLCNLYWFEFISDNEFIVYKVTKDNINDSDRYYLTFTGHYTLD